MLKSTSRDVSFRCYVVMAEGITGEVSLKTVSRVHMNLIHTTKHRYEKKKAVSPSVPFQNFRLVILNVALLGVKLSYLRIKTVTTCSPQPRRLDTILLEPTQQDHDNLV
jgi:hypothetical protein